jgi:hypothetical protein
MEQQTPETDNSEELTAKQDKALAALISQPSVRKAAAASGLGEATIWRYLRDDKFRRAYLDARRGLVEHATTQMSQSASAAATALDEIVKDKKMPPTARVSAAKTVLQKAQSGVELLDLQERLSEIEKQLKENDDGIGPRYWQP